MGRTMKDASSKNKRSGNYGNPTFRTSIPPNDWDLGEIGFLLDRDHFESAIEDDLSKELKGWMDDGKNIFGW